MTTSENKIYSRNTTSYAIAGTKTFRLSSRAILDQWGTNLQNIEKSMREIYEADEGKLLIQVDQAGAEALIVAYLMPPTNKLRLLFDNKIKIHNYLALALPEQWEKSHPYIREFIPVPIPELKTFPRWDEFVKAVAASDNNPPATRYYYHYKQTGHSANYGIAENTFVENLLLKSSGAVRLTPAQGRKYLEGYHSLIPEIRGYFHRYVAHQYKTTGMVYNFQGFPITLTTKYHEHEFSKIYDKIPQSTVGCITHIAYTNMQNYIEEHKRDWDLLGNCHDSYLAQAPVDEAIECAKIMKGFMEQELVSPVTSETFRMRSEVQIGKNWSPMKAEKNEEGLKKVEL